MGPKCDGRLYSWVSIVFTKDSARETLEGYLSFFSIVGRTHAREAHIHKIFILKSHPRYVRLAPITCECFLRVRIGCDNPE